MAARPGIEGNSPIPALLDLPLSGERSSPACHDFHMPPGNLSHQELILVERIMRGDGALESGVLGTAARWFAR